jgi:hypothetical protein
MLGKASRCDTIPPGVRCTSHLYIFKSPIMAPPVFTISAARQAFFDLFATVTAHRGRKVIITSRGSTDHAVLVAEQYLKELESAARELRDIKSGKTNPPADFRLIGSGRIARGVDDPLAEIRAETNRRANEKLTSFGK